MTPRNARSPWAPWSWAAGSLVFSVSVTWLGGVRAPASWAGVLLWSTACAAVMGVILATGRMNPYRFWLFAFLAVGTVLAIKFSAWPQVVEWDAKAMANLTPTAPICHIALAGYLGNLVFYLFSAILSPAGWNWAYYYLLGVVYLAFTLLLGTAWCSWACGYGAWDESMSRLAGKKPLLKLPGNGQTWSAVSGAIALSVVLLALLNREAVFCRWLCPFKLTEDLGTDVAVRGIAMVIWITTLAVFVIALPLLSGRRTFCSWLCPFGAWQRLAGKLNPFTLAAERSRCTACGQCQKVCPMQAIEVNTQRQIKVHSACHLCGLCIDVCPTTALTIGWRGRVDKEQVPWVRTTYIVSAIVLVSIVGDLVWAKAGVRLWSLFTGQGF